MIAYEIRVIIYCLLMMPCFITGQDIAYRVQAQDVSISSLIDLLEKSYNVQFSYPSDLLAEESFYLRTNTPDLSDILDEITAIYPIEYQILENKSILLREQLERQVKPPIVERSIEITIIDKASKAPLEAVAVGIMETAYGAYSNKSGAVKIQTIKDLDNLIFEIHLLGYKKEIINYSRVIDNTIMLTPQSFEIEEVMVQDRMDVVRLNTIDHRVELSTSHISSFTSGILGKDVMRQAQLLPGLAAFDDKSSGLKIRGADEASSLIVLDDIPIYNASHYYGLFGSINPAYTTSSILYKNNLPVTYDGKTSGMLKINGPSNKLLKNTTTTVDINLLTIAAATNIPLDDRLSLTLAGRTSYQNVSDTDLFSLFNETNQEEATVSNFSLLSRDRLLSSIPDFEFFDINGKLKYSWDSGFLEFNYFQSRDDLDDSFENKFRTRRGNGVVINTETYANSEIWKNQGFNVKLQTSITNNIDFLSILYKSSYDNLSGLELGLNRRFQREEVTFGYNNTRENTVDDIGLKAFLTAKSDNINWIAGIDVIQHKVKTFTAEQDNQIINSEGQDFETSGFMSITQKFSSSFKAEFSLRGTMYKEKIYPSPRINLTYKTSEKWLLKGSVGRHNQFVRQLSFENSFGRSLDFWVLAGRIEVSKADQVMIGGAYKYDRLTFDIETYYRKRYNLLEQALFNPRFEQDNILPLSRRDGNEFRLFRGDGETIGVDITVGITYPKYSGWLSYTLSKSTVSYDRILQGTIFPSQDDRRHQVKWINEYRIGDFTLGANWIFASGRPYTDLNKVAAILRRDQVASDDRISRLPDYIRTDVAITYGFDIPGAQIEVGLSAYNLIDRQNVNYIQSLYSIPTNSVERPNITIRTILGTESALLGRTINLNLQVKF